MNVVERVVATADRDHPAVAVQQDDVQLTHAYLVDRALRLATVLRDRGSSRAAVIGVPHDLDEVRAVAKERVAAYTYPRLVWQVEDLPKTATGKILRREVPIPEESQG